MNISSTLKDALTQMSQQIDECYPSGHNYKYEDKLVAYIDILGWKNATQADQVDPNVEAALIMLDRQFIHLNEEFRNAQKERFGVNKVNPVAQLIELGFFSDGFLMSMPADLGRRIFGVNDACRNLLALGFLCRGGITRGYCYHRGNRVLGPAINDVIELEKQAFLPRVLCNEQLFDGVHTSDADYPYTTTDILGRKVLNLFPPFIQPDSESIASIEEGLRITEIRRLIHRNIKEFSRDNKQQRILEKWHYAQLLMETQIKEGIYDKSNETHTA